LKLWKDGMYSRYTVLTVEQYREKYCSTNAEFCRAIGVKPQQYREYLQHFVMIDGAGINNPVLILKGKEIDHERV